MKPTEEKKKRTQEYRKEDWGDGEWGEVKNEGCRRDPNNGKTTSLSGIKATSHQKRERN